MATDPLYPANVVVTIAGSALTTTMTDFSESGGEANFNFVKTLNRNNRVVNASPGDLTVTFAGTVFDNKIAAIMLGKLYDSKTITFAFTGSLTVTYNNVRNATYNNTLAADDRMIYEITFKVPFYDTTGSLNRVIV